MMKTLIAAMGMTLAGCSFAYAETPGSMHRCRHINKSALGHGLTYTRKRTMLEPAKLYLLIGA